MEEIVSDGPVSSPLVNNIIHNDRSLHGRSFESTVIEHNSNNDLVTIIGGDKDYELRKSIPVFSYESFISRTWSLVVLAVAIFGTCIALWMFIYVLIKMCDGTLSGNQTMGLLLLMGVTGLFASVIPWLLPPNHMICTTRHFLHPLIMVLCFAILLVKAMQLRSLVSVGLGGTIPQINQIVSLVFMLLVQVVIAGEWYATSQPLGVVINDGYPECNVSKSRFLLLHLYPCTLLLLAFFYGVSVLKIKRNFNEGRWITCATIFVVPIFAAWSLVYYFAPTHFHDPSVAVSIVAVAGIILSAIFIPKMHTIAHQSKLKNLDMIQRSPSDSTVFTGFSDFVAPFPPSKNQQKYYPVFGYHNPPYNGGPSRPPPMGPFVAPMNNPTRVDFNGLNYVSNQKRGPRLTSYAEWAASRNNEWSMRARGRPRRRHSSSPQRSDLETASASIRGRRSKSSSKEQLVSSRGRSRKRSTTVNSKKQPQTNPQHLVRIHTAASAGGHNGTLRSLSPSDGMILTASGLRDTMSESYDHNVVIVDGLNDTTTNGMMNNNVYLTTS